MKRVGLLFLVLASYLLCFAQSPGKLVRKGNYELMKGNQAEAKIKYREALEKKPDFSAANYNIGNINYNQEEFEKSIQDYNEAIAATDDAKQLSNYYYNLGNALFQSKKLKPGIEAYKNALRNNPENKDARHNLFLAQQLLKQQQQQQQQQQKDQKPPEPSEYAKQLKKQAQELVAQRRYAEAYNLMIEGEKKDPTVAYYKEFTNKIKEVNDINSF